MSELDLTKLNQRVSDLENESGENARRFDAILKSLDRLVVAVSGDPQNDILGVIGRMKIIAAQVATLQRQVVVNETEIATLKATVAAHAVAAAEWMSAKHQLEGASKVGRAVWAFIGAGGLVLVWKAFELFGPK